MKIGETHFRYLWRNLIAIKGDNIKKDLKDVSFPEESDSVLTWCYIDSECGMTFEFLCPFNLKDKIYYEIENKDFMMKWRKEAVNKYEMEKISRSILKSKILNDYIDDIIKHYENNYDLNDIRREAEFDHLREKDYPDDILVTLYKENLNPENLWVRTIKYKERYLIGLMLNEPYQDFGVHFRDLIEVEFTRDKDNKIIAFYNKKINLEIIDFIIPENDFASKIVDCINNGNKNFSNVMKDVFNELLFKTLEDTGLFSNFKFISANTPHNAVGLYSIDEFIEYGKFQLNIYRISFDCISNKEIDDIHINFPEYISLLYFNNKGRIYFKKKTSKNKVNITIDFSELHFSKEFMIKIKDLILTE